MLTSEVDTRTVRIKNYNGCRPKTWVFKWIGKSQLSHWWWFQIEWSPWFIQKYFSVVWGYFSVVWGYFSVVWGYFSVVWGCFSVVRVKRGDLTFVMWRSVIHDRAKWWENKLTQTRNTSRSALISILPKRCLGQFLGIKQAGYYGVHLHRGDHIL